MSKWHKSSGRIQHHLKKQDEMEELLNEGYFEEALGYNHGRCTLEEKELKGGDNMREMSSEELPKNLKEFKKVIEDGLRIRFPEDKYPNFSVIEIRKMTKKSPFLSVSIYGKAGIICLPAKGAEGLFRLLTLS